MAQQRGSLPHYLAIKNELERRIISGQLRAGERFPSEEELSQEFGVSTSTIKRAIGVLVADGLVERTPGRGTFVSVSRVRNPLRSFTEEMRSRGLMPSSQLIAQEKIKVEGELAWHQQISDGSEVYYIARLRLANNTPVAVDHSYIPVGLCPNLFSHNLAGVDVERLLDEYYHLSLVHAEEFVTARKAAPQEIELLGPGEDDLVILVVERQIDGVGDQRVMYSRTLYRADRYILHFDLKRE